jgi:hypothetical protein
MNEYTEMISRHCCTTRGLISFRFGLDIFEPGSFWIGCFRSIPLFFFGMSYEDFGGIIMSDRAGADDISLNFYCYGLKIFS